MTGYNQDEIREYIKQQLIRTHPSRAMNTDEYYKTIADEAAKLMDDEFTVKKMLSDQRLRMVSDQVSAIARQGSAYMRRCRDGLNDALIEEPGAASLLMKVPVFEDGRERPVFWNVRVGSMTYEDLIAWAQWSEKKANENHDAVMGAVEGGRNWARLVADSSAVTVGDLMRRAA